MFREAIRRASIEAGHQIVGETGSGRTGVTLALQTRPDVVLLDWSLPDIDGFEVSHKIRLKLPQVKILVISAHQDAYTFFLINKSGAQGFLDKNTDSILHVGPALLALENNRTYFSENFLAEKMARAENPHSFLKKLSDSEQEVLRLIGTGLNDHEIGEYLSISHTTAQTHRRNISQKLEIAGTPKLMVFALENGITPLRDIGKGKRAAKHSP